MLCCWILQSRRKPDMTTLRRNHAMPILAAAACLALAACSGSGSGRGSGSGSPAARSSHSSTPKTAADSSFCHQLNRAVLAMTSPDTATKMSLQQERHQLSHVLEIGIRDFTALEKLAPGTMVAPLRTIVAEYRSERTEIERAPTHRRFVQDVSMTRPARSAAFRKLYTYTSGCTSASTS
jgi:hypothetical protein